MDQLSSMVTGPLQSPRYQQQSFSSLPLAAPLPLLSPYRRSSIAAVSGQLSARYQPYVQSPRRMSLPADTAHDSSSLYHQLSKVGQQQQHAYNDVDRRLSDTSALSYMSTDTGSFSHLDFLQPQYVSPPLITDDKVMQWLGHINLGIDVKSGTDATAGNTASCNETNGTEQSSAVPNTRDSSASSLSEHECLHPGCGKMFQRQHNLRSHMLIHTDEKPFRCNGCSMSFRRNHDLRRHARLHTGIKPYMCPRCDKPFSRSDALRRHMKVEACISSITLPISPPSQYTHQQQFQQPNTLNIHIMNRNSDHLNTQPTVNIPLSTSSLSSWIPHNSLQLSTDNTPQLQLAPLMCDQTYFGDVTQQGNMMPPSSIQMVPQYNNDMSTQNNNNQNSLFYMQQQHQPNLSTTINDPSQLTLRQSNTPFDSSNLLNMSQLLPNSGTDSCLPITNGLGHTINSIQPALVNDYTMPQPAMQPM